MQSLGNRIQRKRKIVRRDKNGKRITRTAETNLEPTEKKAPRQEVRLPNGLMNEVAAAAETGLSIKTLQNRRTLGKPPEYTKIGGSIYYSQQQIFDFMSSPRG